MCACEHVCTHIFTNGENFSLIESVALLESYSAHLDIEKARPSEVQRACERGKVRVSEGVRVSMKVRVCVALLKCNAAHLYVTKPGKVQNL